MGGVASPEWLQEGICRRGISDSFWQHLGKVLLLIPMFVLGSKCLKKPLCGHKKDPQGKRPPPELPNNSKRCSGKLKRFSNIFQPHFGFLGTEQFMNSAGDGRLPSTLGPTSCGLQARWPDLMGARMIEGDFPWLTTKMDGFNGKTVVFVFSMQNLQTMDGFNWWITETLGATWFVMHHGGSAMDFALQATQQAQRLVTYNACETSQKSFGGGTEAIDLGSPRRDVSYLNI